ncbi:MAG: hypothetical protein OES32_13070 [Acidobacteriota bacterium]|nr:hypothetical protein [Acidobacteriota bacterium]
MGGSSASDLAVFERIVELLRARGCPFELLEHPAAATAREAAAARGTELALGTKAILFKYGKELGVFAMSADRAVHSARIRRALGVQRTRFATAAELRELTGLAPGEVPPFGEPVLPFPLYADPSVLERPTMLFTAGSRTRSIRMAPRDYEAAAKPRVFRFVR